jgi:hypothetical protein
VGTRGGDPADDGAKTHPGKKRGSAASTVVRQKNWGGASVAAVSSRGSRSGETEARVMGGGGERRGGRATTQWAENTERWPGTAGAQKGPGRSGCPCNARTVTGSKKRDPGHDPGAADPGRTTVSPAVAPTATLAKGVDAIKKNDVRSGRSRYNGAGFGCTD